MSRADDIDGTAARWLTRRDDSAWSPGDEHMLQAWLNQDTRHRVSFLRLEAAWSRMDRLSALRSPAAEPLAAKADAPWWISRRAAAAVAMLLIPASLALSQFLGTSRGQYETTVGGAELVALDDGSRVRLNTDTRVAARLSSSERRVELAKGEAFFEVAKDKTRPFVVEAGNYEVTAVGTAFSVRREGDAIKVVVSEGAVAVQSKSDDGKSQRLRAGNLLIARREVSKVAVLDNGAIADALSWRDGLLVFNGRSLGAVAAEFNRYSRTRLIVDRRIADLRISGSFNTSNAEGFVRLMAQNPAIRVRTDADGAHLLPDQS